MRRWTSHQREVEVAYDKDARAFWVLATNGNNSMLVFDKVESPTSVVQKLEGASVKLPKDLEWMLANDAHQGYSPDVYHGYIPGNCPQCGGVMKEQCGETCLSCGFHLSCSAEP